MAIVSPYKSPKRVVTEGRDSEAPGGVLPMPASLPGIEDKGLELDPAEQQINRELDLLDENFASEQGEKARYKPRPYYLSKRFNSFPAPPASNNHVGFNGNVTKIAPRPLSLSDFSTKHTQLLSQQRWREIYEQLNQQLLSLGTCPERHCLNIAVTVWAKSRDVRADLSWRPTAKPVTRSPRHQLLRSLFDDPSFKMHMAGTELAKELRQLNHQEAVANRIIKAPSMFFRSDKLTNPESPTPPAPHKRGCDVLPGRRSF